MRLIQLCSRQSTPLQFFVSNFRYKEFIFASESERPTRRPQQRVIPRYENFGN
jgi:hypothetical protein